MTPPPAPMGAPPLAVAANLDFIKVPFYAEDGRILIKFGTLMQNDTL